MSRFQKFGDIKKEALKDPAVKAAYDALESEHRMAYSMIRARRAKRLTQGGVSGSSGRYPNDHCPVGERHQ